MFNLSVTHQSLCMICAVEVAGGISLLVGVVFARLGPLDFCPTTSTCTVLILHLVGTSAARHSGPPTGGGAHVMLLKYYGLRVQTPEIRNGCHDISEPLSGAPVNYDT